MQKQKGFSHVLIVVMVATVFGVLAGGWYLLASGKFSLPGLMGGQKISNEQLALALLTGDEIATTTRMQSKVIPQLVQFNDRLYDEAKKYNYRSLVARETVLAPSFASFFTEALVLFDTKEQATQFIFTKAKEADDATVSQSFGGTIPTLTLVNAGTPDELGSVTIRFAIDTIAVKVQVYGNAGTMQSVSAALMPWAKDLATKQKTKIEDMFSWNAAVLVENNAYKMLPKAPKGYSVIGKTTISLNEWLGATYDRKSTLPGFVSGGLVRFKAPDLANTTNAVEVVVLEFATEKDALAYQDLFFKEGVHIEDKTSEKLDLPASLSKFSVARTSDEINELMAVKGNYLYDVTVMPFGDVFDKKAEAATLIRVSEELLK